jgi:hypothetical protein
MAHKYALCGRLRLLSPFARDMHLPPARAEKWISKRGTLRFIQENDTGRARTPHFLPSVYYGRQVVSSRVQGGRDRTHC